MYFLKHFVVKIKIDTISKRTFVNYWESLPGNGMNLYFKSYSNAPTFLK